MQIKLSYVDDHIRSHPDKESLSLIESIFEEVRNHEKPTIIFDIDSTILDPSFRTAAIFHDYATNAEQRSAHPEICELILQWEQITEVYHPIEFVNTHTEDIVLEDSHLGKTLYQWWRKRFFHPDWLVHDRIYPGVETTLNKLHREGAHIKFLTGRSEELRQATIQSFDNFNIPLAQQSDLVMKQNTNIRDIVYKADGLHELKKQNHPMWYIENEVELVLMAIEKFPDIHTILFDSVHSGRRQLDQSDQRYQIPTIRSWAL